MIFKNNIFFTIYSKKLNFNIEHNFNFVFRFNNFSKKKYLNFYFYYNKKFYYNFNYLNKFFYNNFINILFNFFKNNNNIIIVDNTYNYILPLYNIMYDKKVLNKEKNFFFLKKKFITLNNWVYCYYCFLNKHNVKGLFFLDYYNYKSFFNVFLEFNRPIFTFLFENTTNEIFDFFFYINSNHYFNKIIIYNLISNLFIFNFNFNLYYKKKLFFNIFKNFIKEKKL